MNVYVCMFVGMYVCMYVNAYAMHSQNTGKMFTY